MAAAILLLPVPLGPRIMFKCGPGANSAESYVRKLTILIRLMDPATYLT